MCEFKSSILSIPLSTVNYQLLLALTPEVLNSG